MNATERWISNWLACSKEELQGSHLAESHSLFAQELPQERESIAASLLFQLHGHLRGNDRQEERVWAKVIWQTSSPIPLEIIHDLIDRALCIVELGHTQRDEDVLRRLSSLNDEALLSLATELYQNPERSVNEFADVLDQHPAHSWLYRHLSHQRGSSPEKHAAFLKRVAARPEWQLAQDRKALFERHERERLESAHHLERARVATEDQEIRDLYATGDFEVLLILSRNPATPLDLLATLSEARNFSGAQTLRSEAKSALHRIKEQQLREQMKRLINTD